MVPGLTSMLACLLLYMEWMTEEKKPSLIFIHYVVLIRLQLIADEKRNIGFFGVMYFGLTLHYFLQKYLSGFVFFLYPSLYLYDLYVKYTYAEVRLYVNFSSHM